MFGPIIKENIQNPTGHGVDISKEERYCNMMYHFSCYFIVVRYEKCQNCHSHLISLKDEAYKLRATSEPVSKLIRDLKNTFSRLD